jgi:hypothetical protein
MQRDAPDLFQLSSYHNQTNRVGPQPRPAATHGTDAEPIGLGGVQAFQQNMGTGGRGGGGFPVFFQRRVALGDLHFIKFCPCHPGDMQHTLATFGSEFRPKLVRGRQGSSVDASNNVAAQIEAGRGQFR